MHIFENEQEKIDFLKRFKLMPRTFTQIPTLYHFEIGSNIPDECEVIGYDEIYDNWATVIIKAKGKQINIHSDYLLEMKNKGKSYHNLHNINDTADTYVIFDIETTGLNNAHDKIIELAAIKVTPTATYEFSKLVKIDDIIPLNIQLLTGITNDMLSDAESIETVLPAFLQFIGNHTLVGHNIKTFDIHFIYKACEKLNLPYPTNKMIDTLKISRDKLPDLENHRLETICTYYGIDTSNAHRALKDCQLCLECYQNLLHSNTDIIPVEFNDISESSFWYKVLSLLDEIISTMELPSKGLILKNNQGTKVITRSICINEPPYPATQKDLDSFQNTQSILKIEETEDMIILTAKANCMKHLTLPDGITFKPIGTTKSAFVQISITKDNDALFSIIKDIVLYRLKTYTSSAASFGCCSRHIECSDAGKCVHENKLYATACQYRRNLEKGRIFYGKNRNID